MTAVADTSVLCYLVLIGEIELLPRLFHRVFLPSAVVSELLHPEAPDPIRRWANDLPGWVCVQEAPNLILSALERLQEGERQTILVAHALQADLVLLDERPARRVAATMGMRMTGMLGVLADGALKGFLDRPAAIDRLRRTTFRCSPSLLKATLERMHGGKRR